MRRDSSPKNGGIENPRREVKKSFPRYRLSYLFASINTQEQESFIVVRLSIHNNNNLLTIPPLTLHHSAFAYQ
jgi:hypothetical protein